jgi:hypothetical protein
MSTRIVGKFATSPADIIKINMPADAKALHFDMQRGVLCLWAIFTPGEPVVERKFRMAGTGHPIRENEANRFINTLFISDLVFHFFEI